MVYFIVDLKILADGTFKIEIQNENRSRNNFEVCGYHGTYQYDQTQYAKWCSFSIHGDQYINVVLKCKS